MKVKNRRIFNDKYDYLKDHISDRKQMHFHENL